MGYETFDWEKAAATRRSEQIAWLKEHHNKPVTQEEFIAFQQSLRSTDTRGGKANRYQTSRLRGIYRRLKEKYGFFV